MSRYSDDELGGLDEVTRRRIQRGLERLNELAQKTDPERTLAWVRDQARLEILMAKDDGQTSLRLPAELLQRAEDLVPRLAADPNVTALVGRITRSTVIKLALARGLDQLDDELPAEKPPKRVAKKKRARDR